MTSRQMYEIARDAVAEYEQLQEGDPAPEVLWVGGILEDRRAVVWLGEKLYMVTLNTNTEETVVQPYAKETTESEG